MGVGAISRGGMRVTLSGESMPVKYRAAGRRGGVQ
jgi:hypothetical protein